jgi:hypothetical protein
MSIDVPGACCNIATTSARDSEREACPAISSMISPPFIPDSAAGDPSVIDQQLEENATTHHRERTARRARLASTSEQFA